MWRQKAKVEFQARLEERTKSSKKKECEYSQEMAIEMGIELIKEESREIDDRTHCRFGWCNC